MTFLLLHLAGYTASVASLAQVIRGVMTRHRSRSKRELLIRITRLEYELGLGVDWALDRIGGFAPILSRPSVPGYSSLRQYAFRCYGCSATVVYADYDKRPLRARDKRHLLCDSCLPSKAAA